VTRGGLKVSGEIAPAQETGSDRKVAKSVIPDMLGPRHPWRGTLSSSDPVPFAFRLSLWSDCICSLRDMQAA